MSYSETLEEKDGLRVRLVVDDGPSEPYDDGQSPLLRIDIHGYGTSAEHIQVGTMRPTGADSRIEEAARRWGGPSSSDWAKFEKYLKAFYGVTRIETYWSDSYWYATYDSAEWREVVGAPEGSASLEEYKAWCEGEVYGYIIEEQVTWASRNGDRDNMTTWDEIGADGSSWGYYGYGYAESEARQAFKSELADRAAGEPALAGTPPAEHGEG